MGIYENWEQRISPGVVYTFGQICSLIDRTDFGQKMGFDMRTGFVFELEYVAVVTTRSSLFLDLTIDTDDRTQLRRSGASRYHAMH
jgi:hypothetical protein